MRPKQNTTPPEQVLGAETGPGLPVHLKIPAISLDASIQQVGIDAHGVMETPGNTADVGWFNLGSRPGSQGSAVIAGHVDTISGGEGVFAHISKLNPGDMLYIEDNRGEIIHFTVRESRIYNPGYAEDVFSSNDGMHLNLITCDGTWDEANNSFTKRLVVFTDRTN